MLRRKRSGEASVPAASDETNGQNLAFGASFLGIISKRGLGKLKARSSEFEGCVPLVTVTADHHVSVLGKRSDASKKNSSITEESDSTGAVTAVASTSPYREFSTLQYNSRPGSSGSFFSKNIPNIASIFDPKNDVMWGVQHGNRRLCCWNAWEGSGPDEATTMKVELQSPLLSLSLLSSVGAMYGTCENGNVFVAAPVQTAISNKKRTLSSKKQHPMTELVVEYLPGRDEASSGGTHLGTFAEMRQDKKASSGRKRKVPSDEGSTAVTFYQVYNSDGGVQMVRHMAVFSFSSSEMGLQSDTLVKTEAHIDILESDEPMASAKLLVSASTSSPKAALVYSTNDATFAAAFCLSTASLLHSPICVAPNANQFGLVADTVLASASKDTIHLYDLETGSLLHKKSVKKLLPGMDGDWALKCDTKASIMAIFYAQKGELHVSFSAATLAPRNTALGQSKINASIKLSSSLLSAPTAENTAEGAESAALKELARLNKGVSDNSASFTKVFEECVCRLQPTEAVSEDSHQKTPSRPRKSKGRKEADLGSLPQRFIDGAVELTLAAMKSEKNSKSGNLCKLELDTRTVLKRLLRSGRVSARQHFEGTYPLQETSRKHPLLRVLRRIHNSSSENPLSAMQLIVEMLQNCPDLSERQLVILMDYMMRHPDPDDIARAFTESTALQIKQMLKQDSKDYIAIRKESKCGNSTDSSEESEVAIGRKLVVAGVELVLHMILCYSECNEVMLRSALSDGLTSPIEATLLAQLLARMLKSSPSRAPSMHRKNPNFVQTTCQWIASLSESFEDELKQAQTSSGDDFLSYLLDEVQNATRNSQAIISFKDSIGIAEAARKELKKQTETDSAEANAWPLEDDLAPYSIDRIMF
ncbi:MAG: hypothetical protein SGILL_000447 [Bacillariaceae sp.]